MNIKYSKPHNSLADIDKQIHSTFQKFCTSYNHQSLIHYKLSTNNYNLLYCFLLYLRIYSCQSQHIMNPADIDINLNMELHHLIINMISMISTVLVLSNFLILYLKAFKLCSPLYHFYIYQSLLAIVNISHYIPLQEMVNSRDTGKTRCLDPNCP